LTYQKSVVAAILSAFMLQFEVATDRLRTILARGLHLVVSLQNAEESLGIDEGVVHVVVDAVQLPDRRADIGKEHHVVHDFSYRHAGIVDEHEVGREDDDEHRAYLFEKTLQTIEEISLATRAELLVGHRALDGSLSLRLYLLAVERLDDGDALQDVELTKRTVARLANVWQFRGSFVPLSAK